MQTARAWMVGWILAAWLALAGCAGGGASDTIGPDDHDAAPDAAGVADGAGVRDDVAPDAGGQPVDATFRHTIFRYSEAAGLSGVATGSFETASVAYPPIPVDARYTHALTFRMTPFLPPLRRAVPSHGPLVLFSDDLDVLVFSPMDHFFVSVVGLVDGELRHGLSGEVDAVPEGFAHRFLLVEGKGIGATIRRWGALMLEDRGKTPPDRYADVGLSYLGYWTDNGAYYYYSTEAGMNEAETMLAVKADADANGIPLGYLQIDSWWYFKDGTGGLIPPAGLLRWEPRPEVFPDGLAAFQQALGLPLIAHNRWFDKDNVYRSEHEFVVEGDMALPTGQGVFDEFMTNAASWGVVTYEQDWLITQYWGLSYLRDDVDHAATWMGQMDDAAAARDITMQLCMPGAAHLMDSVDRATATTIRTSTDYQPSLSKETYWPAFHTVNLLAGAVGLWPFKDNFRTAEEHGEAEALVSALSAGMVGVGDGVGQMDRDILLRTCRADGLLLKPDVPVTPIDAMFLEHTRPYVTTTSSHEDGLGSTTYVAAYHLASEHPQRTPMDRGWAALAYDGEDIGALFVFPEHVTDWHVDLAADLNLATGDGARYVVYDWRAGTAASAVDRFTLPVAPDLYDFAYVVIAPVQTNGLALIGEPAKYVTLADRRFRGATVEPDGFALTLEGAPGEEVRVLAWDADANRLLPPVTATIGADGRAATAIRR